MLESIILTMVFPNHIDEIMELHQAQYYLKIITRSGVSFDGTTARSSGSPETSCFNSIANAYMAYAYLTKAGVEDPYCSLGIYGGDDGLTPAADPDLYLATCKEYGQVLTLNVIREHERVQFLSRIYTPDVWYGETWNCCDIRRTLTKLHLTVGWCDPQTKFKEKLQSLALTDGNTVLIHEMVQAYERITGATLDRNPVIGDRWFARYEENVQFQNDYDDSLEVLCEQLPDFNYLAFLNYLDSAKTVDDLLKFPLFTEPVEPPSSSPISCMVNGEYVHGQPVRWPDSAL